MHEGIVSMTQSFCKRHELLERFCQQLQEIFRRIVHRYRGLTS